MLLRGDPMEMKWLRTFVIAAEYENFRKASELLFLTQPAVTKHIQRLEEYLQGRLFVRTGKTVMLSVEGHRFLPIAKTILAEYEEGMTTFEAWRHGYVKQLTIATAPQIASSILPAILKDFMVNEPKIEVLINVINSYEVINEVVKGQVDLGLTRTYTPQSSLQCEVAFEEPVVLVAPYSTEIEQEAKLLQTYRLITHNHPVYWDDLLREIKRFYSTIKTLKVNQIEVTKKFIEQGLGVSYLPYSMVEKEIKANLLKLVVPDKVSIPISQTYIVTKVMTPETTAFMKFFKEEINKKQSN